MMEKSTARIYMTGILFNMRNISREFTKLLIMSIFLLILSSCDKISYSISKPWLLEIEPPPGPPIYQAAYVDGCSLGVQENHHNIEAMRNSMYKHPVYNKTSNLYRRMWRSAYTYCYLWWPKLNRNSASFFKPSLRLRSKGLYGSHKWQYLKKSPQGPRNFRVGWNHGCDTGKAATGKSQHKIKYGFKKDPRYIEGDKFNKEYEKGWETAFWYCQRFYDIYESPERKRLM